jgi:6-phosphogluconolactonase (cycloisomerase 2 family)
MTLCAWNRVFNVSLRKARKIFPNPQAWAALSFTRRPSAFIISKDKSLTRPEGLAFTRKGDLMAVGNSDAHSVSVFASKNGLYSDTPCCVLSDPTFLSYVHDVAFSPCGQYLAAVAREDHSVSIFRRSKADALAFEAKPICTLKGPDSHVRYPAALRFHPSGDYLAVANRQHSGVTLHRFDRNSGFFANAPHQMVSEADLLKHGLAAPHGLDFTPDGKYLVVVHKRFLGTDNPDGVSAITFYRWDEASARLEDEPIHVTAKAQVPLHSASFHPSGRFFAVSEERRDVEVFEWRPSIARIRQVDSISIFRCGYRDGPKGACFTADGKSIAVTTLCDQVLYYSDWGRAGSFAAPAH